MLLSPKSIANVSESLSNATLESSESFIALVAGESLCLLTGTSLPNSSLLFNIRCHADAHTLIDFPDNRVSHFADANDARIVIWTATFV